MSLIEAEYQRCRETPSDIDEFLPVLKEYSATLSLIHI